MAIIDNNETVSSNNSGFNKTLEASASTMIFDNLQVFMYRYPEKSTVRECVSNAVDSVKEKNIAVEILTGKAKVSDYFVEREGDLYKDSKFDPSYYDLKYLSDENKVTLTYLNTDALSRDIFTIEDTGVGLGKRRLEKYFALGFSSKRLNSSTLGAFGLGNKSPLSTGIESYRIVSRYNGMEFAFDVYSHKVDSVYSKWNEDGTLNNYIEFEETFDGEGNPYKAYYRKTDLKNSVSVIIEVKKHNKHLYFEAVKSQLMYLKDDITFYETFANGGTPTKINFKANIFYEDDYVVLSDNNHYSRPHFVIKGVGYGLIDYNELELTSKFGNIGVKMQMDNIDVTPSRESVVYSGKTRGAYLDNDTNVTKMVTEKVNASLKSDNFVDWIRACNKIAFSSDSSNDVISRISNLIDRSSLNFQYDNTSIKHASTTKLFMGGIMNLQYVTSAKKYDYAKSREVYRINRTDISDVNAFNKPLYFQFSKSKDVVTKFILTKHPEGYTVIRCSDYPYLEDFFQDYILDKYPSGQDLFEACVEEIKRVESNPGKISSLTVALTPTIEVLTHLKASNKVFMYDESVVPEDYVYDGEEDLSALEEAAKRQRHEEIVKQRKLNDIIVTGVLSERSVSAMSSTLGFRNIETKLADIDFTKNIVYGSADDLETLKILGYIKRNGTGYSHRVGSSIQYHDDPQNDDTIVYKVSKTNAAKHFTNGIHIDDYLVKNDAMVFKCCDELRKPLTSMMIQALSKTGSEFLTNFSEFDKDLFDTNNEVWKFLTQHKSSSINITHEKDPNSDGIIFKTSGDQKVMQILVDAMNLTYMFIRNPQLDEEAKATAISAYPLLSDFDVLDIDIVDMELINKVLWIQSFCKVYSSILNHIGPLRILKPVPDDLASEIKVIINLKRDQLEFDYPNLIK